MTILIAGGGLSGLLLGSALHRLRIPFHIFERDPAHSTRAQGYRIRINSVGLDALKYGLGEEGFDTFENICAVNEKGLGRVDAVSGEAVMGEPGGGPGGRGPPPNENGQPPPSARFFSLPIDRTMFRSTLLSSIPPDCISFSKRFTHFTTTSPSSSPSCSVSAPSVVAHFADGSAVEGSLLVGADGINSAIAEQLLSLRAESLSGSKQISTPRVLDTGTRMIFGKTPLTSSIESTLHPNLSKGLGMAIEKRADGSQLTLFCEVMRFTHVQGKDYIYWVISGEPEVLVSPSGSDSTSRDTEMLEAVRAGMGLSGGQASALANTVTGNWAPEVRVILEGADEAQTSLLRMTTSDPRGVIDWSVPPSPSPSPSSPSPSSDPASFPPDLVTLIGDAAHCMPPTGGSGANTGLKDASTLARLLGTVHESFTDSGATNESKDGGKGRYADAVEGYEAEMRQYASEIVRESYNAATKHFGVRPLDLSTL